MIDGSPYHYEDKNEGRGMCMVVAHLLAAESQEEMLAAVGLTLLPICQPGLSTVSPSKEHWPAYIQSLHDSLLVLSAALFGQDQFQEPSKHKLNKHSVFLPAHMVNCEFHRHGKEENQLALELPGLHSSINADEGCVNYIACGVRLMCIYTYYF